MEDFPLISAAADANPIFHEDGPASQLNTWHVQVAAIQLPMVAFAACHVDSLSNLCIGIVAKTHHVGIFLRLAKREYCPGH